MNDSVIQTTVQIAPGKQSREYKPGAAGFHIPHRMLENFTTT